MLERLTDETRLVVSEPLGDLPGAWSELPESSCAIIAGGKVDILPFSPPRSPRPQRPAHVAGAWPA